MQSRRVRLTQLDGSLPNLALMQLAWIHRFWGDVVTFTRQAARAPDERGYDIVYGSSIFKFSADKVGRFMDSWPDAIVGGTGVCKCPVGKPCTCVTVERMHGSGAGYSYDPYPAYAFSIGFTQRGCRLACKFCVVPGKEGRNRADNPIEAIWRGPGYPKKLHLLDNDFFGQPEDEWRGRVEEIRRGGFKVCFNQGINVRLLTPAAAQALASMEYRDDQFQRRRLYTAWDNLKDERVFFDGMEMLRGAGIPMKHVMAYMLVGWDKNEDWDRIWYRFYRMVDQGIRPYPMVFDCRAADPERYHGLKRFQRWVVTGLYRAVEFSDYDAGKKVRRGAKVVSPFPSPSGAPILPP